MHVPHQEPHKAVGSTEEIQEGRTAFGMGSWLSRTGRVLKMIKTKINE